MKAVLVIDMPRDCSECQFCGFGGRNLEKYVCCLTGEHSENTHLVGCPLRPLPEKKNTSKLQDFGNSQIVWTDKTIYQNEGWNDCLDEIEKEPYGGYKTTGVESIKPIE